MFLLHSGAGDAPFNMALDEALLDAMPRLRQPVLRFYSWTERAATFGYFQKFSEVEHASPLRPLVRRPTGGGIVPHDADWTYSLAFPAGHQWHSLHATESYHRAHEWIQSAFAKLNIGTELAHCCKKLEAKPGTVPPGQCFLGYEKSDVLWHGRKIAGAAQRRNKLGLLIQGSVQPPPISLARADWEKAMQQAGEEKFSIQWQAFSSDESLKESAHRLIAEKYSQAAYNQKR
jgi:lipoate-protein ligase A